MLLQSANLIIYVYLALCACMLVFDVISAIVNRRSIRVDARLSQKWRIVFMRALSPIIPEGPAKNQLLLMGLKDLKPKYLFWKNREGDLNEELYIVLRQLPNLMAFHEETRAFLNDPVMRERMLDWMWLRKPVFVRLADYYLEKESMYKAYYAYLMWQYNLGGEDESDPITNDMIALVIDPSVYCRENALQALYCFGGVEPVVKAYLIMSKSGIEHSSKLVTDGLLEFTGEHSTLCNELWKNWDSFNPFYRTAFVNYMRMANGSFCKEFYPAFCSEQTDRELRLAIIRYYRRFRYESARPLLQEFVLSEAAENWEFAALSASALDNYPGEDTIRILADALRHRNWYVRNNAAESLLALAPNHPIISTILDGNDSYAREMLTYKIQAARRAKPAQREKEGVPA